MVADHSLDHMTRLHAAGINAKRSQFELRISQHGALLSFKNCNVFEEDASLLSFQSGSKPDVVYVEIAAHSPEIVTAGVALRSQRIDDKAANALIMLVDRRAGGNWRHAYIDDHGGRRQEVTDLPAIDRAPPSLARYAKKVAPRCLPSSE